jgi:GNAT superfamily N-acetyltransferase
MIRPVTPDDTDALIGIARASCLFDLHQVGELSEMLTHYFAAPSQTDGFWVTVDDGGPIGVAYVAPEKMTDGTWNLCLIAVHPDHQRLGRGTTLLEYIELLLSRKGQRILLVETSGNDADGVDKIVFRKVIRASEFSISNAPVA